MNLPEDFAGGRFNLPLKIAKLVRKAYKNENEHEQRAIIEKLYKMGYFLDTAAFILWDNDKIPKYVMNSKYADKYHILSR